MQNLLAEAFKKMGAAIGPQLDRAVAEGVRRFEAGLHQTMEAVIVSVRGELPWLFDGATPAPEPASPTIEPEPERPATSEQPVAIEQPVVVEQPVMPTATASVASSMAVEKVEIKPVKKQTQKKEACKPAA